MGTRKAALTSFLHPHPPGTIVRMRDSRPAWKRNMTSHAGWFTDCVAECLVIAAGSATDPVCIVTNEMQVGWFKSSEILWIHDRFKRES